MVCIEDTLGWILCFGTEFVISQHALESSKSTCSFFTGSNSIFTGSNSIFLSRPSSKVLNVAHLALSPSFCEATWAEKDQMLQGYQTCFPGSENLNPCLLNPSPLKPLYHADYRAVLQGGLEAEYISSPPLCLGNS